MYGKELILDLHECRGLPAGHREARVNILRFCTRLCNEIDMVREDLYFWDDEGVPEEERETEPHLVGTSAVQFIRTSNITIHTLPMLKAVYINIFSCKDFEADVVAELAAEWFKGDVHHKAVVERG